jgi:hypothetical protein
MLYLHDNDIVHRDLKSAKLVAMKKLRQISCFKHLIRRKSDTQDR